VLEGAKPASSRVRAGVKLPIEACRQLGARVLGHLKLARWEFTRKPPQEAHGSALTKSDEAQQDVAAKPVPPTNL